MKELTVTYMLDDNAEKRLAAILASFQAYKNDDGKQPFADWTETDAFNSIMTHGSKWDIQEKLAFAEQQLNLPVGETWKTREGATT